MLARHHPPPLLLRKKLSQSRILHPGAPSQEDRDPRLLSSGLWGEGREGGGEGGGDVCLCVCACVVRKVSEGGVLVCMCMTLPVSLRPLAVKRGVILHMCINVRV